MEKLPAKKTSDVIKTVKPQVKTVRAHKNRKQPPSKRSPALGSSREV